MAKMKRLFICDTPFQTLNALNIQWHDKGMEYETDMYIVNQFTEAISIYTEIEKTGLFSSVYLLKKPMRNPQNTFVRGIKLAWYYLHPGSVVRRQLEKSEHRIPSHFYDMIMASVTTLLVVSLCKLNPKAEFNMFDDGAASYYGNIAEVGGWKYKIFSRIFRCGNYAAPQKLYVNNADMCKSIASVKIEQLPFWDKDFINFVCKIFSVDPQINQIQQRVILLLQPFEEIDFSAIVERLSFISNEVLIRFHPKEKGRKVPETMNIDNGSVMWELRAAMTDMNNKILIGYYSTAQMTPKLLFDQEPWLIFLYRIDESLFDENRKKSLDILVGDLKASYRDKGKIFIPESINEFKEQLDSIIKWVDRTESCIPIDTSENQ